MNIHDKLELQYKQNQAATDKDGIIAAKLRKKLIDTLSSYGILDAERKPSDTSAAETSANRDGDVDKFDVNAKKFGKKEKSLNKLDRMWKEAELSGLSADELKALKEEFTHYQEKVDMYYSLFDDSAKNRYASTLFVFFLRVKQLPPNCLNTVRALCFFSFFFFFAVQANVLNSYAHFMSRLTVAA